MAFVVTYSQPNDDYRTIYGKNGKPIYFESKKEAEEAAKKFAGKSPEVHEYPKD